MGPPEARPPPKRASQSIWSWASPQSTLSSAWAQPLLQSFRECPGDGSNAAGREVAGSTAHAEESGGSSSSTARVTAWPATAPSQELSGDDDESSAGVGSLDAVVCSSGDEGALRWVLANLEDVCETSRKSDTDVSAATGYKAEHLLENALLFADLLASGADASTDAATSCGDSAEAATWQLTPRSAQALGMASPLSLASPVGLSSPPVSSPPRAASPDSGALLDEDSARRRLRVRAAAMAADLGIRAPPAWEMFTPARVYPREVLVFAALHGAGASSGPLEVTMPVAVGSDELQDLSEGIDIQSVFSRRHAGASWRDVRAAPVLQHSEHGYRICAPHSRSEEIKRQVNSLLNKICPDNLQRITEQLAEVHLSSVDDLELVISLVFQAALTNSHYCETYADMIFAVKSKYKEFPPEEEDEKPVTFTRVLLNFCQNEFERLPETLEPAEEELRDSSVTREDFVKQRKDRMLAHMRFLGHLFLRNLLSPRILQTVVSDLLDDRPNGDLPEEHHLDCACELLTEIGFTLETKSQVGRQLMETASLRLLQLKNGACHMDGSTAFSKRMQFRIDDLLELRSRSWCKKLYRETARTLGEIRRCDGASEVFSTTKAGVQPAYMTAEPAPEPAAEFSPSLRAADPCSEDMLGPVPLGTHFDRPFVSELLRHFAAQTRSSRDAERLCQRWRSAAPTSTEAAQGVFWILEIGSETANATSTTAVARHMVCAEAISGLLRRGFFSWKQLQVGLARLVSPLDGARPAAAARGVFAAVLAQLLQVGLFSTAAFRSLPSDRCLAWDLLIGVLKLVTENADVVVQKSALSEFWDVLCAIRNVPSEQSEQELLRDLVFVGAVDKGLAAKVVLWPSVVG